MNKILSLTSITFREGIRNRAIFGVALFALFVFGLNICIADFFMRDIGKVTVDMNLASLSLAGLLLVFFVGINLMSKDIDRKTIHLVLSKPISRFQYVLGKYFGIASFVTISLLVILVFSAVNICFLKIIYPDYFLGFLWSVFFISAFFEILKILLIVSIVIFFSTITTNSFITLVFSICTFLVGSTIEDVRFYLQSSASNEISISPALRPLIDAVSYVFPNLSAFDFKTFAAHGIVPSYLKIGMSFSYGLIYIVGLLLFASFIFRRREFN